MLKKTGILLILILSMFTASYAKKVNIDSLLQVNDFAPDVHDSTILKRMKKADCSIAFSFNEKVRRFIDYFTLENRDYTRMVISRKEAYFPIFEAALKRHNMPEDLKYLAIVESGLNPRALSPAGALGLWQFMPSTGKMYNLNYDYYIDERMDPYKATEAACKFLKQLYNMFGDWELALAAYNCGPGNIRKALRNSGPSRNNFWEIYNYLPQETRSYVPQFMAFCYVMRYSDEHNLFSETSEHLPLYDTITVNHYFNVLALAPAVNLCEEELTVLNPELKRNVIPSAEKNYPLRIPVQAKKKYNKNKVVIDSLTLVKGEEELTIKSKPSSSKTSTSSKTKQTYKVKRGDVLGKIATKYNVRVSDLRKWNNISSNNVIHEGQILKIYSSQSLNAISIPSTPKPLSEAPKYHTVKKGETLWSISKSYEGLTLEKLKELNNISGNGISQGQRLRIK